MIDNTPIAPHISIVVPLLNEEEVLPGLVLRLDALINSSELSFEVILVDDGSTDTTPFQILHLGLKDDHYTGIILSRNFGHQAAITAGMQHARGTIGVMIIDGDLQDPPELFPELYICFQKGFDIVYGVREERKENVFKKMAYTSFYQLLKRIANIEIPAQSGDFCFMSRKAVDCINLMPEESRFLRGLRSWTGFSQYGFKYKREQRSGGKPKYSFKKLMNLAFNGIFNFSEFPIKFISFMGLLAMSSSIFYFIYVLIRKLLVDDVPTGFTAIIFTVILFGGVQLLSISILGEYIIRIFFQVKNRPLYIIKRKIINRKTE